MVKNVFVILLMAVIPCLSQVDVRIAERLALDTAHAYDAYYQELIETERSLQGIGGNILGTAVGATLTAVGVLFVVAGDGFVIPGIPSAAVGSYLLVSNIMGFRESMEHARKRFEYENIYELYKQKRKVSPEVIEAGTAFAGFAMDSLVAEQLALDPSHSYDTYYKNRIATELSEESIGENVVGIIIGGGLAALGGIVLSTMENNSDDPFDGIGNALILAVGVPLIASGGSLFVYNIYAIHRDLGHKRRRMENERAYDLYKGKYEKTGVASRFFLVPTFNVASSGAGLNLFVTF